MLGAGKQRRNNSGAATVKIRREYGVHIGTPGVVHGKERGGTAHDQMGYGTPAGGVLIAGRVLSYRAQGSTNTGEAQAIRPAQVCVSFAGRQGC